MENVTLEPNYLPIVWKYQNGKGPGENRSKLLATDSGLYQTVECVSRAISSKYVVDKKRMDYHIEIINKENSDFEVNAQSLANQTVDVHDITNWGMCGRAFVLFTPPITSSGSDCTHITVAFWKDNRPSEDDLKSIVKEALNLQ